jgi:GxxExxY protein
VNHRGTEAQSQNLRDQLTEKVIGCAIEVHKFLGAGFLESAYRKCLVWELQNAGLPIREEVPLPLEYKGMKLDVGYRIDLIVEDSLIVELKTVHEIAPIHIAQTLTYMRLAKIPTGLLLNFHVSLLKDGIKRLKL